MSKVSSAMRVALEAKGKISPHYDLTSYHACEIKENSREIYDVIHNAFKFGYMQGVKAEKVAQRKLGVI